MSREVFTLSEAIRIGQIITAQCSSCGRKRSFHPEDWLKLLGDVPCYRVEAALRCTQCGTRDHMRARFGVPTAAERQTLRLTRLKGIRYVRRVVWEDEQ